jgi:FkbM family methyltransferase
MVRIRPELLNERIVRHLESADAAVEPTVSSSEELDLEAIADNEGFLIQAFRRILGRMPELDAFLHFSHVLNGPRRLVLDTLRRATQKPGSAVELDDLLAIESNVDFVRAVYLRMFRREGEPAGIANWQERLDAGLPRPELILEFSRCEEAAQTEYVFQGVRLDSAARALASTGAAPSSPEPSESPLELAGLCAIEDDVAFLHAAYRAILGRAAEPAGVESHLQALRKDASREEILLRMAGSPEAKARARKLVLIGTPVEVLLAGLEAAPAEKPAAASVPPVELGDLPTIGPNADFVRAVYLRMFRREGEPAGIALWQERLDAGLPRPELLLEFSRCEEAAATAYVLHGVPLELAAEALAREGASQPAPPYPVPAAKPALLLPLPPPAREEGEQEEASGGSTVDLAGFDQIQERGQFVYEAYRRILGRKADFEGFRHYRNLLHCGWSGPQLLAWMAGSAEARQRNLEFIRGSLPPASIPPLLVRARMPMRRLLDWSGADALEYGLCLMRDEVRENENRRREDALRLHDRQTEWAAQQNTAIAENHKSLNLAVAKVQDVQHRQGSRLAILSAATQGLSQAVREVTGILQTLEGAQRAAATFSAEADRRAASVTSALSQRLEETAVKAAELSGMLEAGFSECRTGFSRSSHEQGMMLRQVESIAAQTRATDKNTIARLELQKTRWEQFTAQFDLKHASLSDQIAAGTRQTQGSFAAVFSKLDTHILDAQARQETLLEKLGAVGSDIQTRQNEVQRGVEACRVGLERTEAQVAAAVAATVLFRGETNQNAGFVFQKLDSLARDVQVREEAIQQSLQQTARTADVAVVQQQVTAGFAAVGAVQDERHRTVELLFQKLDAMAGDSQVRQEGIDRQIERAGGVLAATAQSHQAIQRDLEVVLHRIKPPVLSGPGLLVAQVDDFVLGIPQEEWRTAVYYVFGGGYEQGVTRRLREIVRPGMAFVDVGANVGIYTLLAARLVGQAGKVYSFEPAPRTFEALKQNVITNGFEDRVDLSPLAVLDKKTRLPLYVQAGQCGWNTFFRYEDKESEPVMVQTIRLDDALSTAARIDIVKIDAEGAEPFILRGMKRILKANPQVILLIEFAPSHLVRAGVAPADFLDQLARFFIIHQVHDVTGELLAFDRKTLLASISANLHLQKKARA